jgi:pantetheine-phosphate adenylyltransferase
MNVALYPGSFDPITNGHVWIIHRGLEVFDRLIVTIARNVKKTALFDLSERQALIREALGGNPRVDVETFDGLLVDYARAKQAKVILRGLRAVADFEYEFQMANMNRKLAPEVETIFMMTGEEHFYVSSALVKEVASLGGDVSPHVPKCVFDALTKKLAQK